MYDHNSPVEKAKRASVVYLLLFFIGSGALVFLYLHFVQGPQFQEYMQRPISGRVERIVSMGKGVPTVLLRRQPTPQILLGPQSLGQYLAVGDSVVKPVGTRDFFLYRTGATGTEVSAWRYAQSDEGGNYTLSRHFLGK